MSQSLSQLIEKHVSTLKTDGTKLLSLLRTEPIHADEAHKLAHKLKGAAGSLGFQEYTELVTSIEAQCKAADTPNALKIEQDLIAQFAVIVEGLSAEQSVIYAKPA